MHLAVCVVAYFLGAGSPAAKEPELRNELLVRVGKEQAARMKMIQSAPLGSDKETDPKKLADRQAATDAVMKLDAENRAWLTGVIEKTGWPGKSRVGREGAQAAWLLVQHADADRPFQKKCLVLLEKAVRQKDADPIQLAYLTDRVLVADGKKQKYGTQLDVKDGKLVPGPVDDEAALDDRRKALGLQSMAEYIKAATEMYAVKPGEKK